MAMNKLKLSERLTDAITLLIVHGIISDSERNKALDRLDKWAMRKGLRRKGSQLRERDRQTQKGPTP